MSGYSGWERPPLREWPRRYAHGYAYLVRTMLGWLGRPESVQAKLTGLELVRVAAALRAELVAGGVRSGEPIMAGGSRRGAYRH